MDKGTCSVDVCDRPIWASGLCNGHYQWRRIHGETPTHRLRAPMPKRTPDEARATARAWKARNPERVRAVRARYYADHDGVGRGALGAHLTTHGMSHSREFRSWEHAKSRVSNPNHHAWADYGGRGITMAPEWLASFEAFYAYMGPRPAGTSLDRIDPDGNYEPGNVRWADAKTQGSNRRNVRQT